MTDEYKRYKIEFHRQGIHYRSEFRKTIKGIMSAARSRFCEWDNLCPYTATVYGTNDPSYRGAVVNWTLIQTLKRDQFVK